MAVVLIAVAGCAGGNAAPGRSTASGVDGRTMVDGGCPVVMDGSPCPDRPVPARLTVTRPGSTDVVAGAVSGQDGRFRIPLPPGRYVLHAANRTGAIMPVAPPVDVDVPAGRYVSITVPFDSGVR